MSDRVKNLLKLFSSIIGAGFCLILYWTFLVAYFSGEMKVLVSINRYGEAHIEFVLLFVLLPFALYGFYKIIQDSLIGLRKRKDNGGFE